MDYENDLMEQTTPEEALEEVQEEPLFEPEEELAEDSQPQEQAPEEKEPQPETEQVFKVKYNGQEQELPVSELVTLAQKGMNYDHVYGELNQLRNAREFQFVDRMAAQYGMTREEYIEAASKQVEEAEIAKQMQNGVPEEVARRLYTLEQTEKQRRAQEEQRRTEEIRRQQYVELAREYPDIREFPQEVIDAVAKGETPLAAYRAWDLRQTKQKLEILQKNREIRERTAGSAAGDLPQEDPDGFMDAFDSALHG